MSKPMSDKRYTRGGDGSHWEGCHETHWDCRIAWLEERLEHLDQQLPILLGLLGAGNVLEAVEKVKAMMGKK
jgi:hypothetical protein